MTVEYRTENVTIPFEPLEKELIPLGAAKIEITLGEVRLDPLQFDRNNPRISYVLQSVNAPSPSQERILELLWEDPAVKDLKRSIAVNGGLIEAIITTAEGVIIEGNCRVACYRKLREENPGDERWEHVRARILPPGITREQLDILLGELHIAGKNEWSPFEQAAHLYKMNVKGYSEAWLAEAYRLSKTTISHKIRAYRLMTEKFLNKYSNPKNLTKWSYFEEFYKCCKPPASSPDGEELEEAFIKWVGEEKFSKGSEVRELPRVLGNPSARKVLDEVGFSAAWDVVKADNPELDSALFRAVARATDALENAPLSELNELRKGNKAKIQRLRALRAALDEVMRQANLEA